MESKTIGECKEDGYQMALKFMTWFRTAFYTGKHKVTSFFGDS